MSNNDFYTVAYKILSYLNYCYEKGEDADTDILSAGTFNITNDQFNRTLKMLIDKGYVDGAFIKETPDGYYVLNNISRAAITVDGIDYLSSNESMQKAHKQLGGIKQWLPVIK